jgi:signal transduction histidine kinase
MTNERAPALAADDAGLVALYDASLDPVWPASLGSVVRQLLASPDAIAIGCGPDLRAVHNEAFAAIIGNETGRDDAVRPLRELCAPLWPRLARLVDRALESAQSVVLEDQLLCRLRDGYAEEAYLRFACGPLMADDDTVAGVVVTITDNTDRVISVRRTAVLREIAAISARCSVAEACRRALAALARHTSDIPFALLYLSEPEGDALRLVATAGISQGTTAAPGWLDCRTTAVASWPAGDALRGNRTVVVDDVVNRFGTLPAGDWPFAPRAAALVPLTSPGHAVPEGVLICGISARHILDGAYLAFIELVANQIGAAIAGGRVHEEEERSARARTVARLAEARRRARLRALKAKFAGALEERTRLAREIHDTLLQGVTGIALQLRAVLPDVGASPDAAADTLREILDLAERTSREARQAVWDMRPANSTRRDLARALEVTARRLTAATSIQVRLAVAGRARALDAHRHAAVVRVVQEAIANAVRHADARTIHVEIRFGDRRLDVTVTDDGRGFVVQRDFGSYEGHWGLLGMQERASSLGGVLTVRSAPGRGAIVRLVIPYSGALRSRRLQSIR